MHKSVWTNYFHDLSPEEGIRLFAGKGWRLLELGNEQAADLLGRGEPETTAAEFLRFCDDLGVCLPQGHLKLRANIALPPGPERDAELNELKRWLDLFAALGITYGVLHPGVPHLGRQAAGADQTEPLSAQDVFGLNVDALGTLTEHAAGGPTTICLENGPNAAELLKLIEAVGAENLGICFDTGHLALTRERTPEKGQTDREFIRQAADRLRALHITDNDGSRDQHLLPFEGGKVDWPGVMRGLREVGYGGLFNFEIPGETGCPVEERLDKLDRAWEIADQLMALEE